MVTKECAIKVRISDEMNSALREYALKTNRSISELVREAIDNYLEARTEE